VGHGFFAQQRGCDPTKTHCYVIRPDLANGILGEGISLLCPGIPALKKNFQNGIRLLTG